MTLMHYTYNIKEAGIDSCQYFLTSSMRHPVSFEIKG